MSNTSQGYTRKDFLRLSAATAISFGFAGIETSCSTLPVSKLPALDRNKGILIRNCKIVDVEQAKILPSKTITIIGGEIKAVTDAVNAPSGDFEIVDANGRFVIPGLIDGHCHTTLPCMNGWYPSLLSDIMIQIKRNYTQQVYAGVTTVRDCGAAPILLARNIKNIEKGDFPGPRVVSSVMFMNIQNSHPDIDPHDLSFMADLVLSIAGNPRADFVDTADLKRKLDENMHHHPAFVKLTLDNESVMCGKAGLNVYSEEHIAVMKDFAARHVLPISGHCHRRFGFERALAHGISLEHSLGDSFITEQEAAIMAQKKMTIVPTITVGQLLAHEEAYDTVPKELLTDFVVEELKHRRQFLYQEALRYCQPAVHKVNMDILKRYREVPCDKMYGRNILLTKTWLYMGVLKHAPSNLKKMKEAGVLIGCGTDAGVGFVYHGTVWREMEILVRAGFSPAEALRCATINNAKILRMENVIGSLKPGKYADAVVLEKNPLEDITACRNPLLVFKGGRMMFAAHGVTKEGAVIVV